jgi:hypothetical protein
MKTAPAPASQFAAFVRSLIAQALVRAFSPPPDIPIWKWADEVPVWLQSEDAAEAGPYRSIKTVWTRRIQELPRKPFMWCWDYSLGKWTKVQVTQCNIQKSTQSGFTEAVLNVIRWMANFLTRNVLYAIDTIDEAKKIARRLLRSLKHLDPRVFTDDIDDIKSTEFILRGMELIFVGSFARGKFANKQAWLTVNDELEEHDVAAGETSTTRDSFYRGKTHDEGIQLNLSKPKLEGGPINALFKAGNREEFHIACPHCGHLQWITHRSEEYESPFADELMAIDSETGEEVKIDKSATRRKRPTPNVQRRTSKSEKQSAIRNPHSAIVHLPRPLPLGETRKCKTGRFVYDHCRDLMGNWDELKILNEVFYECPKCKGRIEEDQKHQLCVEAAERDNPGPQRSANQSDRFRGSDGLSDGAESAAMSGWLPTAIGTPGIISQHMNDLLSTDRKSSWGRIVLELLTAKKEGPKELQGVINNRFGNAWREELSKTNASDIRDNVAGKTLWFVDYQTDTGSRREVFESKEQAVVTREILKNGGAEVGPIIPSYCKPYKRGTIPFVPYALILGSDVGGNYARRVEIAVLPNMIDVAVIDWGDELDPEAIAEVMLTQTWPCLADGKRRRLSFGFIDSHWRTVDVLRACWHVFKRVGHKLIPTAMIGGAAARGMRGWSWHGIQGYHGRAFQNKAFKQLGYNFRESMNDLFITCIQRKQRRVFFPIELGKIDKDLTDDERQFITELTSDELIEDKNGKKHWADPPPGPNHYGAALKNALTGLRFLTKKHHLTRESETPGEEKEATD